MTEPEPEAAELLQAVFEALPTSKRRGDARVRQALTAAAYALSAGSGVDAAMRAVSRAYGEDREP